MYSCYQNKPIIIILLRSRNFVSFRATKIEGLGLPPNPSIRKTHFDFEKALKDAQAKVSSKIKGKLFKVKRSTHVRHFLSSESFTQ